MKKKILLHSSLAPEPISKIAVENSGCREGRNFGYKMSFLGHRCKASTPSSTAFSISKFRQSILQQAQVELPKMS